MPMLASSAFSSSVMTFKDVKNLADSQKGLELPGFSPYSAVQSLISQSSRGWAGITGAQTHLGPCIVLRDKNNSWDKTFCR